MIALFSSIKDGTSTKDIFVAQLVFSSAALSNKLALPLSLFRRFELSSIDLFPLQNTCLIISYT